MTSFAMNWLKAAQFHQVQETGTFKFIRVNIGLTDTINEVSRQQLWYR